MLRPGKMKKKQFISDKIVESFTVKPRPDVEDDLVFDTKPTTVTKDDLGSEDDGDEAVLSNFRKQNVQLLHSISDRYAGEVSTRSQQEYEASDSDEEAPSKDSSVELRLDSAEEEGSDVNNDSVEEGDHDDEDGDDDDGEESEMEDDSEDDDDDDDGEGIDLSQMDAKEGNFEHMKRIDESEEVGKGKCVRNQLLIWENLLEMRIALQKCLVGANKMPLTETHTQLKEEDETFAAATSKTKNTLTSLLHKMLDLQTNLLHQYPETKNILSAETDTATTNDSDEEILSDEDDIADKETAEEAKPSPVKRKFSDISKELGQRHSKYAKYRNSTIQKWYDKTRVTQVNSKNKNSATSTLSQIEFLLGDKSRLIRRTQLKRSNYDIIGEATTNNEDEQDEEYCNEIYDDDDFYHQLLRELIEYKSSDISDPIQLSRQWIALQQMRNKMKRKVDRKATKGRRIRYAVHTKLVNFMAPKKNPNEWTDESKDELYGSLFGKQYEADK